MQVNFLSWKAANGPGPSPNLAKAVWAAEVDKMIHTFRAPIDQASATAIVDYLSETKAAK